MTTRYELYIEPERPKYNVTNGRFMKGHVPWNKGKKWDEYLTKRQQKKMRKGWANVIKNRPTKRPDTAGRCRKQVVAVMDDGQWVVLLYIGYAGQWIGGHRENVRRCCMDNQARRVNKYTGAINTDHKYMGVRFYYESDDIWTTKIKSL